MPNMAQYKIKLLDEFESRSDEWGFGDFERRLQELRKGASYHDAKGIINDAHRQGNWPNVVKRYLSTNFKAFGNVSAELNETFSQVVSTMTSQEKEALGL